ncbi:MAG: DUF4173 domain-containing protein [Clostridiaceae bacterium]|nr:DUF4173 domain-containing protein [Clostridiaceae bacterium]
MSETVPSAIKQDQLPLKQAVPSGWLLCIALGISLALVVCIFWGGWGLGFFIAASLAEAGLLLFLLLPEKSAGTAAPGNRLPVGGETQSRANISRLVWVSGLAIFLLSACYFIYDNLALRLLNAPVILILFSFQLLIIGRVSGLAWDNPWFWLEIALAWIVRPFVCLNHYGRGVSGLFNRSKSTAADKPAAKKLYGSILIGLLLALPVLLILGALLSAADPVFGNLFRSVGRFLADFSLDDWIGKLIMTLLIMPFVFSYLFSGRSGFNMGLLSDGAVSRPGRSGFSFNRPILITFLSCVNLLYLIFALVQVTYLTGAFRAELPDGLTYAEYARSGFFELSFVCLINLVLILLAVRSGSRQGLSGKLIRIESLLLIAGSAVQWFSAMFRMRLYIQTFGLTLLRFYVTAFMFLLAVLFLYLLIREFVPSLPLFKWMAATTLIALLALNFVNADAWIARHNVERYLNRPAGSQITAANGETTGESAADSRGNLIEPEAVDADYFQNLSMDAVPALCVLLDSQDAGLTQEIAGQLLERYEQLNGSSRGGNVWQSLTISRLRAENLIGAQLDNLRRLNPKKAAEIAQSAVADP